MMLTKQISKRVLAFLLTLAMMLGVMGVGVFAADTLTMEPATVSGDRGGTYNFSLKLNGSPVDASGYFWSLDGNYKNTTTISQAGVLTIASNETTSPIKVQATPRQTSTLWAFATVTLPALDPVVKQVMVNQRGASMSKGSTKEFTATVSVLYGAAETVIWSVSGNDHQDTKFNDNVLSVSANETATSLTVKATSTVDATKSDTATVNLTAPVAVPSATISDVTITATAGTPSTAKEILGTATITLTNAKFESDALIGHPGSWFEGAVNGRVAVGVTINGDVAADGQSIVLTFEGNNGTLTEKTGPMSITIPKDKFKPDLAADLTVTANANAKWNITATPKPTPPTFTPISGTTFTDSLDVTLSKAPDHGTYYTLDGTDPVPNAGTTVKYTVGTPIHLTATTTIKAVSSGLDGVSDVATATYTKVAPGPTATATPITINGTLDATDEVNGGTLEQNTYDILITLTGAEFVTPFPAGGSDWVQDIPSFFFEHYDNESADRTKATLKITAKSGDKLIKTVGTSTIIIPKEYIKDGTSNITVTPTPTITWNIKEKSDPTPAPAPAPILVSDPTPAEETPDFTPPPFVEPTGNSNLGGSTKAAVPGDADGDGLGAAPTQDGDLYLGVNANDASGRGGLKYQWQMSPVGGKLKWDNVDKGNGSRVLLQEEKLEPGKTYVFRVRITNAAGKTVISKNIRVKVLADGSYLIDGQKVAPVTARTSVLGAKNRRTK